MLPLENDSPRFPLWPTLGLIILAFAAMGSVLTHEFTTWDDPHTIYENPAFNPPAWSHYAQFWDFHKARAALWVPVTYTVWGLLAFVSYLQVPDENGIRLNPFLFHAASLTLHITSTLLVYTLLRRALSVYESHGNLSSQPSRASGAAFVGAALFAAHPLQVEAVAWTSGLKDLLSCVFSLSAVLCAAVLFQNPAFQDLAARPNRFKSPWFYLGLLLFLLGTLSKPTSMTAPALAVAYCWMALQLPLPLVLRTLWPWFLPVPLVMLWTTHHQTAAGVVTLSLPYRPLIALDALAFYVGKLLLPLNLTFDYGRRPPVILHSGAIWWTWIVPAALLALFLYLRKRLTPAVTRPLFAGLLLLLIPLSPVLGLTKFLYQYYSTTADHYFYPAMPGLALIVGWAYLKLLTRFASSKIHALIAALLIAFVVLSFRQMLVWRDSSTLYEAAFQTRADNFVAFNNRAVTEINLAGKFAESGDIAKRQIYATQAYNDYTRATELRPEFSPAWDGRAIAQIYLFDYAGGLQSLEKAIEVYDQVPKEIRKSNLANRFTLAKFLIQKKLYDRAIAHLEIGLSQSEENHDPPEHVAAVKSLLAEAKALKAAATQPASTQHTTITPSSMNSTTPPSPAP